MRIYLGVPFADKDAAKQLGARWDPHKRLWYVTDPASSAVARWPQATVPLPDLFPGEDRAFGSGLFVDLIPRSCWFTNVRSAVVPADWDRLRRHVYQRARSRCEVCGVSGRLEAHERWFYDPSGPTQTLRRLIALCPGCHETTHMGLAQIRGRADIARPHLMAVNRWGAKKADAHIEAAFAVWADRNTLVWALDLSMLEQAGIGIRYPVMAADRPAAADAGLERAWQVETRSGGLSRRPESRSDPPHGRLRPERHR